MERRRSDRVQKLRDDVIEPADFAFGYGQIFLQLLRGVLDRIGEWASAHLAASSPRGFVRPMIGFAGAVRVGFTGSFRFARVFELFQLPLHQLQMDMEGIE